MALKSISAALSAAMLAATVSPASAVWPQDQTITIIVPQAAGGANDTTARIVANELSRRLGQTVIVENRPGASGAIGMQAVATAAPNGYVLGLASDSIALLDVFPNSLPWSVSDDLVGVARIGGQPTAFAVPASSSYATISDVIDAAREDPGSVFYGTSGTGSIQHLVGAWFANLADIELNHIPYQGGGQAISDLAGGQISMAVLGLVPLLPQAQSQSVRILAVTSSQPNERLPDVPTMAELGFEDIQITQWTGIVAPNGTPSEVVEKLSAEIEEILSMDSVVEQLYSAGVDAEYLNSVEFDEFLRNEIENWDSLLPGLNVELE